MIIDYTYLGYGAGLVMIGWICGMVFRQIISVLEIGKGAL